MAQTAQTAAMEPKAATKTATKTATKATNTQTGPNGSMERKEARS